MGRKKREERSRDRQQRWEWAEAKYSSVHRDLGQTSFTETFHSLPGLSEMPHLEILPLRAEHFRAILAYFAVTDYLPDLTKQLKTRTSGEVKLNANIYTRKGFVTALSAFLSQKVIYVM